MSSKSIRFIIGLMSFALLGVLAMQYYFIKESYSFKSQIFDRAVNEALKNVSLKLAGSSPLFIAKSNQRKTLPATCLYQERNRSHQKNKRFKKK